LPFTAANCVGNIKFPFSQYFGVLKSGQEGPGNFFFENRINRPQHLARQIGLEICSQTAPKEILIIAVIVLPVGSEVQESGGTERVF